MVEGDIDAFIDKFQPKLSELGFGTPTPYKEGGLGFSAIKSWDGKNVSMLSVHVLNPDEGQQGTTFNRLFIHFIFGELSDSGDGVRIRYDLNLTDPIDVENGEDYFCDPKSLIFTKNNQEISGTKIVEEFYKLHTKSTKLISGFYLRAKVFFWRIFLTKTFSYLCRSTQLLLFVISGDRYAYEPFFETEELNGKTIKSRLLPINSPNLGSMPAELILEESKKIDFFNFKVRRWSIMVYSAIHALVFTILFTLDIKPLFIKTIFKNNFLTVIYVILSVWVFETLLPKFLMGMIKYSSTLEHRMQIRNVKV